ncbi:MAG: SMC-Scp complex subunit ScpB [Patescibacteria group bacterium]|jgi:segregation and condensation protein B
MSLKSQVESLLFVSLKPLSLKELAAAMKAPAKELGEALDELIADYAQGNRGLAIIKNNGQYQLTTAADNAALVQEFLKDETSGELSQPSLEALTIIAYRGPIAKLELERVRGVNCSLIIRNLLLRGLIEERFDKSKNENYYTVTHDFVRFLGLGSIDELPDYLKLNSAESLNTVLAATEDKN